jgi:AcrR family transcriptional regulator
MEADKRDQGENRATLIRCAWRLFASRGYDGVGVQEIAEVAKVTKPTLYHYFGSKEGLFQAALEKGFTPLERLLTTAAEYRNDLIANLAALDGRPFAAVSALSERQHRIVEEPFKKAAQNHGNIKGRHQAYAASFVGLLNTYIGLFLNGYLRPGTELLHRVVYQFEHGIYS